ncbi:MAG: IPT/TIG domain-containing protein [Bacteroidetes bacterium]|nr:IPT/TIG domain-containing protein [Bacteroidota bacterium]
MKRSTPSFTFSTTPTKAAWTKAFSRIITSLILCVALGSTAYAQAVSVTATGGTTSQTYSTLKAAFDAINAGTHTGAIVININSNTSETAPSVLNSSGAGSASYTSVLVQPSVDAVSVTCATASGRGVIELNGADNVTINGDNPNTAGINRNLTINNNAANTVNYTSVIRSATSSLVTTADNNTIKNCIIIGNADANNTSSFTSTTYQTGILAANGASTSSATTAPSAISSSTATMGGAQTALNFTVNNCAITKCARGIYFQGAANSVCPTLTITNNLIGNATAGAADQVYSIGITAGGFGNATTNSTISGNTIYLEGWFPTTSKAIELGLAGTNTGANLTISNNKILRVFNKSTSEYGAHGISVYTTTTAANITVVNNFITNLSSVYSNASAPFNYGPKGIVLWAGTGHKVYYNSVNIYGGPQTGSAGADYSACLAVASSGCTGLDIRNNIFSNTIAGTYTGSKDMVFLLWGGLTSTANNVINNNVCYVGTGTNNFLAGVGTSTLSAPSTTYTQANFNAAATTPATNWRSYTSGLTTGGTNDNAMVASTAAAPFTSNTDLHVLYNAGEALSNISNKGVAIAGFTTDIDGETRPWTGATNPCIGADEFQYTPPALPTITSFTPSANLCTSGGDVVTITGTNFTSVSAVTFNGTNAASYTVNSSTSITATAPYGLSAGTIAVTNSVGTGTSSTSYTTQPGPVITSQPSATSVTVYTGSASTSMAVASSTGGATYQWYYSISAAGPWVAVPASLSTGASFTGTTSATLGITCSAAAPSGIYYFECVVTSGSCNATSNVAALTVNGYCSNFNTTNTGYYINSFTTSGGLTNISPAVDAGFSANGYGDFTSSSVSQIPGGTVNFTLAEVGGSMGYGIFVDWNGNGSFADAGETMYNPSAYNTTVSSSFTVPAGAAAGTYRMRVVGNESTYPATACTGTAYTECEDYLFTVVIPIAPTITSYSPGALCAGGGETVTITGTGLNTVTAVKFNGVNAASFTLGTATSLTAVTPAGLTAGTVTVTNPSGTGTGASYTVNPSPTITGQPSAGTVSAVTGTSATFTVATSAGSPTYQWYYGTTTTGPWVAVANGTPTGLTYTGGTTASLVVTASNTANTGSANYYKCIVSAAGCGISSNSAQLTITGYCSNTNTTNTTYYIDSFYTYGCITDIARVDGGFSPNGYGNFTSSVVTQVAGGAINFRIKETGGTMHFGIWVDWNNNGLFTDAGENVFTQSSYVSAVGGTFNVPAGQVSGNYRMRIQGNELGTVDPCTGTAYTECEDYTVYVQPIVAPTISSFTPTALCAGGYQTVTITGTGFLGTSAVTFNGVNAVSYTVVSNTSITAVSPSGLTAGVITVTNSAGNANSTAYTIQPSPAITTQPVAATASALTGSAATFTVATSASSPTYQWQYATSATGPWTNVANGTPAGITYSGATTATLTATPSSSAAGSTANYLQCVVTSGCSSYTNAAQLTVVGYCVPSSTSTSTYISNFTITGGLTNFNNSSTYTTGGYANYTATTSASQYPSNTVSYSVTMAGGTAGIAIWVDWNQNGVFTDAGEAMYNSAAYQSSGTYTGTFTVPATALYGSTRMRVLTDFNATSPSPCTIAANQGEGEDYTFTVATPPACSGTPTAGTAAISASAVCVGTSVGLTLTGFTTGVSGIKYQWQSKLSSSSTWANIANDTLPTASDLPTAGTDYRCVVTCTPSSSSATSNVVSVVVNNPTITGTTGATICGPGAAIIAATTSVSTDTAFWYATSSSTAILGTGSSFITPVITGNTTYYVQAKSPATTASGGNASSTGASGTNYDVAGLVFDVTNEFVLSSVAMYPDASGTVTIALQNSGGTTLQSANYTFTGASATPVTVPLGFTIPVGTGYRLMLTSNSNYIDFYRDLSQTFPYAVGTSGSITGAYYYGSSTNYYYFYNWQISQRCASARQAVNVTYTTPPSISVTPATATICSGDSVHATVTGAAYSTFTWTPAGASPATGASVWLKPTATTTYTVNASGAAGGCINSTTVAVTVNPVPNAFTVTPATASLCAGTIQALSATDSMSAQLKVGTQANTNGPAAITSTSADYPAPYSVFYGGQKMQVLILASELTAAGFQAGSSFQNVQFPVVSLGSAWGSTITYCNNFRVKMGLTSATSLTSFATGLTVVVPQNDFTPAVGYNNTHTFATPFTWDGTSNVILETNFSNNITGSNAEEVRQYNSPTAFQSCIVYRADAATASTINSYSSTPTYTYSARPDFKLNGMSPAPITWSPTTQLYTDAGATTAYTGGTAGTVYAKPTATRTYTATATIASTGCTTTSTSVQTVSNPSTAPTSITGTISLCTGGSTTLTAVGGTLGTGASYVWGSGTVGGNVFQTSTSATTSVTPSGTTSYWVSVTGPAPCGSPVGNATTTVTMTNPSTAPTGITGATSVCRGSSTTLTATGGTLSAGANYVWGSGSVGSNVFQTSTSATATVNPSSTTTYWVSVSDIAPCGSPSGSASASVNVQQPATATANTVHTATINNNTTYTLHGSVSNNAGYSWSTNGAGVLSGTGTLTPLYTPGVGENGTIQIILTATSVAPCASAVSDTFFLTLNATSNTWIGNTSDWFTASNWTSGAVPNSCSATPVVIPAVTSPHVYPLVVGATAQVNSITIASGAQVSVAGGQKLGVCGNWVGGSSTSATVSGAGSVEFNGTAAQTMTGNSVFTTFAVNKTAGTTTISGSADVNTAFVMTRGNVSVSSTGHVTLKSNASTTAYLDNFTSGTAGTWSGSITVERYVATSTVGYRDISSPVINAKVSDWAADFTVTGPNNVNCWYAYSPYPTLQYYSEATNSPTTDYYGGFISTTLGTNALAPMRGYAARLYTAPLLINTTGTPGNGSLSLAITKTNTSNPAADGWNLMGNPYPSPISWNAVKGLNVGKTDGSAYLFQATGEYTGNWATWNGTTGTNGATDQISSTQGFMILASGNNTLVMDNSVRVAATATPFFKTRSVQPDEIRLTLTGNGNSDEIVSYTDAGASTGYDVGYDAAKIAAGSSVYLSFDMPAKELAINVMSQLTEAIELPLKVAATDAGDYTLAATELNIDGLTAYLKDAQAGTMTNLATTAPVLHLAGSQYYTGRYSIVFRKSASATTSVENVMENQTRIYSYQNKVYIQRSNSAPADVDVTNLLGQNVAQLKSTTEKTEFELPATEPWYAIVRINENGKVTVQKLLISAAK